MEICRLGKYFVDYLFQIFMKIYCIFPKSDKPSKQEIVDWFSFIVSAPKGCDLGAQINSHSQDSDLNMKDKGYMISNQH
jgi:hypothetical protein